MWAQRALAVDPKHLLAGEVLAGVCWKLRDLDGWVGENVRRATVFGAPADAIARVRRTGAEMRTAYAAGGTAAVARYLADQPVSPIAASWLEERGHEAFHLRDRKMSRAKDTEVFALAQAEDRVLVTADLDFSRIVALSGVDPPGVILFRAGSITDDDMLKLLERVLREVPVDQIQRSIITSNRLASGLLRCR